MFKFRSRTFEFNMQIGGYAPPRCRIGQLLLKDKIVNRRPILGARSRRRVLSSKIVRSSLEDQQESAPSSENPAPITEAVLEQHEDITDAPLLESWDDEQGQPSTSNDWDVTAESLRHPSPKHPFGEF